ncbi:DUF2157 domain-containing protein [Massilia sp. P8910]|uniref:DUF2157 domain-containing protein n=1 Tax=Massilia antarctica TaxID=2765360 RepID=UPI0006BB6DB6|nr:MULTISPECIES: DUF2157 domain-containing protein [Massilia]MCE3608470.1 DUF2157 domain-containing protein [Massilia antarctica]MCY0916539.1 DUF2157 domain-containing protein [Massilia sp. H27-R4]CUI07210.1 putative membrane protein [Janthinobacterium sp. CG23_2]CUU30996.1 putative membrane protein [Janthinobacterium sp. CG23_2]
MDIGLAILEVSATLALNDEQHSQLRKLSGLDEEPANLTSLCRAGLAIVAAALIGLGIIFWIAANWNSLGRTGRFILLQGVVAVMCIGAYARPRARVPLGLLALLAVGAVFAYFGQTYQTGADPWQLFVLWAVLGLPLCLSVRHDALWTPWALIAMSAISLWLHANTGHSWRFRPDDLLYQAAACMGALALAALLSPLCARWTGAGLLSMRVSVALAVISVALIGIAGLANSEVSAQYWLALLTLAATAAAFSPHRLFDMFSLCSIGLALNVLLIGLLAHFLLADHGNWSIPRLLVLGLVAAGLLAATVSIVLDLSKRGPVRGGAQ